MTTLDHFPPGAVAESVELAGVLALWRDAQARGWAVIADPVTGGWRAHSPDRAEAMSYDPPDEFRTGGVNAYDGERTMTWTGVAGPGEAIVHIRRFFGWPEAAREVTG